MHDTKAEEKPAKVVAQIRKNEDQGETIALMEPLVLAADSRHRPVLNDLVMALTAASAGLRRSLPPA